MNLKGGGEIGRRLSRHASRSSHEVDEGKKVVNDVMRVKVIQKELLPVKVVAAEHLAALVRSKFPSA